MPQEERPLEKAINGSVQALSNTELLGLIIHTGTRNVSSLHLAEEVLSSGNGGISELGEIQYEDLLGITGIGPSKAILILSVIELGKRIAMAPAARRKVIESSHDVADLLMERLRYEKKEHFKSILVNTKGEILSVDTVSIGALSSTVVHPREVFSSAVRKSAAGVIFVHNHPSGDPEPSAEDVLITKRCNEAARLMDITLLDHIIIGRHQFVSLKQRGLY